MDRITKSSHFIPMKSIYRAEDYAKLYIDEIVRWHGIPFSIMSDRGSHFTSLFWISLKKSFFMLVKLCTAFHSQTDGQAEHTIQTFENMLRVTGSRDH